jgi:hypothetical protein
MLDYSKETILEKTVVKELKGEVTHQLSFKLTPDVVDVVEKIGLNALNQRYMDRRPDCRLDDVGNDLYLVTLFIAQEGVFNENIKYDLIKSAMDDFKKLLSEEIQKV